MTSLYGPGLRAQGIPMAAARAGEVAVIFTSTRRADDPEGYARAAERMEARAAAMPGYRGFESARRSDGFGIAVSYWADAASAAAWRDDEAHRAVRQQGRDRWYDRYDVVVAHVERAYRWSRG